MYRAFKKSGWLTADRTTIFVDEYQQDNFWEKYRFTLAHETGHYFMHEEVYVTPDFQSIEEQIKYFHSRDKYEVDWYDRQGQWFAGHVLVPSQQLEELCRNLVEPYQAQFGDEQLPSEGFKLFAATELAGVFQVNQPVIEIRIDREGLVDKLLNAAY
jgi:Zn-dependent peptidase ImmA (M78 family)